MMWMDLRRWAAAVVVAAAGWAVGQAGRAAEAPATNASRGGGNWGTQVIPGLSLMPGGAGAPGDRIATVDVV